MISISSLLLDSREIVVSVFVAEIKVVPFGSFSFSNFLQYRLIGQEFQSEIQVVRKNRYTYFRF